MIIDKNRDTITLPYRQVDAFTEIPYQGNPAAVCLVDSPLSSNVMQMIASELNLSETAFIEAPDDSGARHLRWFTPTKEVPLCGHATLASAHVLRSIGHTPPYYFKSASGPLTVHSEPDESLRLDFPSDECKVVEPRIDVLEALGLPEVVACLSGNLNYIVQVANPDIVDGATPDLSRLGKINLGENIIVLSITAPGRIGYEETAGAVVTGPPDVVSRVFAPWAGVNEDPVTGVAHTALGPYWANVLGKKEFTARQGGNRRGQLRVRVEIGRTHLIGHAVTVAEGDLVLPFIGI
tara:strand:+ start:8831 stop:9712 length:882 start_codon:yes stop_codon:yes gene_type:complete